jgi:hypothetical protein
MHGEESIFIYRKGKEDSEEITYLSRKRPLDKNDARKRGEELVYGYVGLSIQQFDQITQAVDECNQHRSNESRLRKKIGEIVSQKKEFKLVL